MVTPFSSILQMHCVVINFRFVKSSNSLDTNSCRFPIQSLPSSLVSLLKLWGSFKCSAYWNAIFLTCLPRRYHEIYCSSTIRSASTYTYTFVKELCLGNVGILNYFFFILLWRVLKGIPISLTTLRIDIPYSIRRATAYSLSYVDLYYPLNLIPCGSSVDLTACIRKVCCKDFVGWDIYVGLLPRRFIIY